MPVPETVCIRPATQATCTYPSCECALSFAPADKFEKFYATFGCGQPNAGYIIEIHAASYNEAHQKMISRFGRVWAFMYDNINDVHPADKCKGILQVLT